MTTNTIPGPRGWPFIGNLLDIRQGEFPLMALNALADQYGPIYRLSLPGGEDRIVVSSQKLVDELCDESKYQKQGGAPNANGQKSGSASGLFFAHNDDPDWGQAHRILMPAFGPLNIASMFDEMHDIAKQLALSWARRGPSHKIDASGDFTRLTLDSIALCAMGYRFNSFYQSEQHPYVDAMMTILEAMANRGTQIPFVSRLTGSAAAAKTAEARATQRRIAGDLVTLRRNNPTDKNDLLNAMIHGTDPRTGEKMRDALIMANMNTFLVAGHETTSGLLSFAMYFLLKNPSAYNALQEEVDRVVGDGALQPHHLKELKYINAVLRETLRLYPPAAAFRLIRKDGETTFTLGDHVIEGSPVFMVLLQKLHRDPEVYGDDAEQFRPERMLEEQFENLPASSWKPFGNGKRSCIGRSFALQEAVLALAILFQRFNFRLDDPSYELQLKFALTIKPRDLVIHANLRHGMDPTELEMAMNSSVDGLKLKKAPTAKLQTNGAGSGAQRLKIFYGSNTGTCEALAQRLLADASAHGFTAETAPLDATAGALPTDASVVIVCPSYEGQPPDNAIHFVEWLQSLTGSELDGVNYTVFGCGHHDWHDTLHRIPKLIDATITKHGGKCIATAGFCDVADSDVIDQFDEWKDKTFWPAIATPAATETASTSPSTKEGSQTGLQVQISTEARAQALRQDVEQAIVLDSRVLTHPDEPEKRHLELQLPASTTYKAGDYLAVLPLNPTTTVQRVMKRFGLPMDAAVRLDAARNTTLVPSDIWLPVHGLLKGYVELTQPPSKRDLRQFATLATEPAERAALEALVDDAARKEQLSTIQVLEHFPSVQLNFGDFLALLPPLRVRLYSISSSPLHNPSACTVSYGVLREATAVANGAGAGGWSSARHHPGVASTYLAALQAEDRLHVAVRPSRAGFHLPLPHPTRPTPVVLIGAGTGLAPFRAFVQERALQLAAQGSCAAAGLAEALLFIGCRTPDRDRLYAEELDEWERKGAVALRYAFSRAPEHAKGCRHVQDRVLFEAKEVKSLWEKGAKIYICGAAGLVKEVGSVLKRVLFEEMNEKEAMEAWLAATRGERVVTDVFG